MRVTDAIADWFAARGIRHYFGYAGAAALADSRRPREPSGDRGHPAQARVTCRAHGRAPITGRPEGSRPVIVTKGPGILNCVGAHGHRQAGHLRGDADRGWLARLITSARACRNSPSTGSRTSSTCCGRSPRGRGIQVRPDTVLDTLNQAYKVATSGRPGPVFIYLPLDILLAEVEGEHAIRAPRAVTSRLRPDDQSITEVVGLLERGRAPLLLAGGGVAMSPGAQQRAQDARRADPDSGRDDADREGRDLRGASAVTRPGRPVG